MAPAHLIRHETVVGVAGASGFVPNRRPAVERLVRDLGQLLWDGTFG